MSSSASGAMKRKQQRTKEKKEQEFMQKVPKLSHFFACETNTDDTTNETGNCTNSSSSGFLQTFDAFVFICFVVNTGVGI
jgi:hypothetical protein